VNDKSTGEEKKRPEMTRKTRPRTESVTERDVLEREKSRRKGKNCQCPRSQYSMTIIQMSDAKKGKSGDKKRIQVRKKESEPPNPIRWQGRENIR
jgi:hypothetical protein